MSHRVEHCSETMKSHGSSNLVAHDLYSKFHLYPMKGRRANEILKNIESREALIVESPRAKLMQSLRANEILKIIESLKALIVESPRATVNPKWKPLVEVGEILRDIESLGDGGMDDSLRKIVGPQAIESLGDGDMDEINLSFRKFLRETDLFCEGMDPIAGIGATDLSFENSSVKAHKGKNLTQLGVGPQRHGYDQTFSRTRHDSK